MNGSRFAGGRVNTKYFGIYSTSGWWWANYHPMMSNVTQSMFFHVLTDKNGNPISARQLDIMQFWVGIHKKTGSGDTEVWMIGDIDMCEYKLARDVMEGVNTPILIATKNLDMPVGGFLTPLYSAINNIYDRIVKALTTGALQAWDMFVGFLDSIFAWLGYPKLFSNFISWLNSFGTWLIYSMTQLITLLTYIYDAIKHPLFTFLWTFQLLLTGWVDIFLKVKGVIDGTLTGTMNLWEELNFSYWSPLIPVLFVIYEMDKCSRAGSLRPAIDDMKLLMDILTFIIDLFLKVANFFLNLIGRIIESIPVVE